MTPEAPVATVEQIYFFHRLANRTCVGAMLRYFVPLMCDAVPLMWDAAPVLYNAVRRGMTHIF
jgi:hypothetical protein